MYHPLKMRRTIVACAVLFTACGGSETAIPDPTTVSGMVVLRDAWGNSFDDRSGVDVRVQGSSTHTTTDASGAWQLDAVPAGTRDIVFTKAGFGTMKIPRLAVVSPATTTSLVTIAQAPTQQAIIDSIHVVTKFGVDTYLIDGHLTSPPPDNAKVGITNVVFGTTSDVSSDLKTFVLWGLSLDLTAKASTFSIALSAAVLRSTFGSGSQVFATAFASSAACGCYTDPTTLRPVFTTAGPRGNVVPLKVN